MTALPAIDVPSRLPLEPAETTHSAGSASRATPVLSLVDREPRASRLAAIRAAGLVRHASERTEAGVEGSLPVGAVLRPLLPGGSLRRGSTVAVATAHGSTSLLFAVLAEASAAG